MTDDNYASDVEDGELADTIQLQDVENEIAQFLQTYLFGNRIVREIRESDGALNMLLKEAQGEAFEGAKAMLSPDLDLYTTEGIDRARRLWASFRRYADMAAWINERLQAAIEAADAIEEYRRDDPDEQLRREMRGKERQDPIG